MPVYIADSNFFIQAYRERYPLDIAPGFWLTLKKIIATGHIISIDKVKEEMYKNNDDLKKWCEANLPDDFFKDTQTVLKEYREVTSWAISKSNHYLQKAINEFADAGNADAFIIAYALADTAERIVLTQEISAPLAKSRIKIPDVCKEFGIRAVDTFGMFRALGESF